MKPIIQTKYQLLAALGSISDGIKSDDSFGGSIEYEARPDGLFDVMAFFRTGNSEGQGGSIIIGNTQE